MINTVVRVGPSRRKIIINLNRRYAVASMFPADVAEATLIDEIADNIILHVGAESGRLCGISLSRIHAFVADWRTSGGVRSLLPILRRVATLSGGK